MHGQRVWIMVLFLISCLAPTVFSQDQYIESGLLDLKQILEEEHLDNDYLITRVYVFLAIKKGNEEYEAYVAKDGQDLDGDQKTVVDEPNDLEEFELFSSFSNKLEIADNQHICYITALPFFEELFPDVPDPFVNDGIIEIYTDNSDEDDPSRLKGTKTLPLIDAVSGDTIGIERFAAFYNKQVVKVEITKKVKEGDQEKEVGTGEFKETIANTIGSYGFIFMQLEESKG
ncbi:MAG: hypothetical protein JXR73_04740 [Candidatus Omnitrophica bacterium]|nr:hypothetical protein [Candidatus Omnitrophota bacterium]